MSWFGEQLSSFTEKLTEITKDVLTDNGNNGSAEGSLQPSSSLPPQQLLDRCKEKEDQIELLMSERIALEKSIEELDSQHQEAVDELLYLKNEAVKENIVLKEELAAEKENNLAKSLLHNFEHNLLSRGMNINSGDTDSETSSTLSMRSINLINVLGVLWKNFNEDTLNNYIKWLREQKNLLENQTAYSGDSLARNVINRINNYIMFLRQVSENPETFSPVIDEIATVIHFLLSNNDSNSLIPEDIINNQLDVDSVPSHAAINIETSDFSSQTILHDFKHVKSLFSSMPEPFMCDNSNQAREDSAGSASQHSQTDLESSVQDCNSLIYEMKQYISMLELEKSDLEVRASELEEQVSTLEERLESFFLPAPTVPAPTVPTPTVPASTASKLTQADEYTCGCNRPKPEDIENYIFLLEHDKSNLEEEMKSLSTNCTSSTSIQSSESDSNCSAICILEQDKSDLEEEILVLKSSSKKYTSSISIQADESDSNCNTLKLHELQTYVSILEQEKNDLNEEISVLKSSSEKCTSSISIQADESDWNCNTSKLHELQTYVSILEQEKNDLLTENLEMQNSLDKYTSAVLTQTDEYTCDCNTSELEAYVCILEQNKSDLESDILHFKSLLNKETVSVGIQTNENFYLHEVLESEISSLKEMLCEKEKAYSDSSLSMMKNLEDLKEELNCKESFIQEKNNLIYSLQCNIGEYKDAIREISEKVQSTSTEIQTDENKCSCEMYQLEISQLKKSNEDCEKEFNDAQNELMVNISELQEEVNSKAALIADNDSALKSLRLEFERRQTDLKYLTDELKILKLSSNDEPPCSCEKYESELTDLKAYINEKEKLFLLTQNDLKRNLNDLNEIMKCKESLLEEKETTILTLKGELKDIKQNIKSNFGEELKALKDKHDYAKDIDTTEECDIKSVVQNCNRCKNVINGESYDNDVKNEVKIMQEKLKALDIDKNQLLCVLNEKSQECSSLKAEVHKLTNIVASEKQALYKLQQDNCVLRDSRDNSDPELTKEAIKKLSQIIRDRDLEVESLKQKNSSLTTLIQDGTSIPDHMQSLIEEKENLTKQIHMLKGDRDKIMVRYNTIDKDCRQYAAEVKKLKVALSNEKEKFDVLEQKHFSVAQQYEEKQKSLINTQNEMIALKQRVSDLEEQQVDIKEKYSELLNKFNSDAIVQLTKDELNEKNSQIEQLISSNSEKDHLIQEKDCLIHDLSQQVKSLKLEHDQQQFNLSNLQTKVDDLSNKLKEEEASVERLQNEKEAFELRFRDKNSEFSLLKEMNERLSMNLKEKEFTIQSMTEKISSLSHYISSDHTASDTVDINQILADSESMFSKAQSLYKEMDETLLALSQSKQENQSLRNEIQRMKSNEIHLKKELERLRMHLLGIEENYTSEALKAEEREKELRDELMEMKRRAEISNTAIVDTNQRASIQIASLQEQLSMIANQRDQALAQVSTLEDKVQQHSASVSKLQLVLEQMQRGNDRKVKDTEKKLTALLENQKQLYKELEGKLQAKEMQLVESSHALEAASRLSEQLDAKEEVIANLKSELFKTESKIKSTTQEIDTIKSNTEGKVDRVVMKSLVLGYFSTPPGQKSEVIRLLARVLDFNQEEMEKAGIIVGRSVPRNDQRGIFSSIFSRLPSLSPEKAQPTSEKSFTTLFVQFLENESQPIVPIPFPVEKMAHDLSFKQQSTKKSPTTQRKSLSRSNPLLVDIDSAFPTFSPVPAVEYSQSPAPSILREVLE